MTRTMSVISRDFLAYKVAATHYDGTPVDLRLDTVEFAIVPLDVRPADGDWESGQWITPTVAAFLIGPDAYEVEPGTWTVWMRITDPPKMPAEQVDTLIIT